MAPAGGSLLPDALQPDAGQHPQPQRGQLHQVVAAADNQVVSEQASLRLVVQVLDQLGMAGRLDWSRASVDTMSVRARRRGTTWAQIQSIVASLGSKLHLVCDGSGLPLTAAVTAANVADVAMLAAVVDDIPPVRTPSGRRRCRPAKVHADKGYDSHANRADLRRRGIRPRIARRGVESSTRLGRHRWRVERSLSWLSCFRRLQLRWDRDSGRWFAFVLLACALVCCNRLHQPAAWDDLPLAYRSGHLSLRLDRWA